MWIFMNDAFLSVVADRNNHNQAVVRARIPGDIERVFPRAAVLETLHADYRFRAFIPMLDVSKAIATRLLEIDYHNFKDSISGPHSGARSIACHRVWAIMEQVQQKMVVRDAEE